jgi:hypothetical protein
MNLKHDKSFLGTKIVLLFIVFSQLLYSCKNNSSPRKISEKERDSIGNKSADTTFIHDTLYVDNPVPYPVLKDTIIYKEIPAIVDTLAILSIYNAKKVKIDTLKLDYGYITVVDTISGSNILSRKYFPKIKVPIKEKIQKIKEEPRGNLYLGLNGGLDKPNYVYSLGTSFLYQTPQDKIYELGIGVWNKTSNGIDGVFVPYIKGGVYWKINFKSKK